MFKPFAPLLVLAALVVSCGDDNPTSPNNGTIVSPKIGSTFTYEAYSTDTTTGLPVAETRDTVVMTVSRTGLTFGGMTNVTETITIDGADTIVSYYRVDGNNDVLTYTTGAILQVEGWFTIPNSSKATKTSVIIDSTSIDVTGAEPDTTRIKAIHTATYVGEETMVVKGESIKVVKIAMVWHESIVSSAFAFTINVPYTLYFASSLGTICRYEQDVLTADDGARSPGIYRGLIDYQLK
jgi:hypothetical protein